MEPHLKCLDKNRHPFARRNNHFSYEEDTRNTNSTFELICKLIKEKDFVWKQSRLSVV